MTASLARSCSSCAHSVPGVGADQKIDFRIRICRRYPPQPAMIPTPQGPRMDFLFPIMNSSLWCGEYAAGSKVELPLPGEVKPEAPAKADA